MVCGEIGAFYYFNARWYDPETGRFITEDPIRDGTGWYSYVGNNPMGFVDPTGLMDVNTNGIPDDYESDISMLNVDESRTYQDRTTDEYIDAMKNQNKSSTGNVGTVETTEEPENEVEEKTDVEVETSKEIGGGEDPPTGDETKVESEEETKEDGEAETEAGEETVGEDDSELGVPPPGAGGSGTTNSESIISDEYPNSLSEIILNNMKIRIALPKKTLAQKRFGPYLLGFARATFQAIIEHDIKKQNDYIKGTFGVDVGVGGNGMYSTLESSSTILASIGLRSSLSVSPKDLANGIVTGNKNAIYKSFNVGSVKGALDLQYKNLGFSFRQGLFDFTNPSDNIFSNPNNNEIGISQAVGPVKIQIRADINGMISDYAMLRE